MSTRELMLHLLENKQDREAYNELRKRNGKKVVIPKNTSTEEQTQILKQIIN